MRQANVVNRDGMEAGRGENMHCPLLTDSLISASKARWVSAIFATLSVFVFHSATAAGESETKNSNIAAIAKYVGIQNWAENRSKSRAERTQRIVDTTLQQMNALLLDIPIEARNEVEAAINSYRDSLLAIGSTDDTVRVWIDNLAEQLSDEDARELREFYESPLGVKLIEATGNANAALTEYLGGEEIERKIDKDFREFVQKLAAIEMKYRNRELTPPSR